MWSRRLFSSVSTSARTKYATRLSGNLSPSLHCSFSTSKFNQYAVRPFVLADIGEGIKECEVIQWFVEPGATIEEFDPICEVQSDKASVEITSRFSGVIKQLHYDVGEMALVGRPLVDIDVVGAEQEAIPVTSTSDVLPTPPVMETPSTISSASTATTVKTSPSPSPPTPVIPFNPNSISSTLATPAVRRICRELGFQVSDIKGSGKDGRVLKEDVMNHSKTPQQQDQKQPEVTPSTASHESLQPLTPIQKQMFKTMTNSLTIPHFLYTDEVEIDRLSDLRQSINQDLAKSEEPLKLSYMPFFIKALSLSLNKFPILNAKVVFNEQNSQPALLFREAHNIGVAMDTPSGLIVPNIKNVNSLSIIEIGRELIRLQQVGATGKLSSSDLKDGTISLSNIGTVGGTYVAPVIVDNEVAIGGLGKSQLVPRYDSNKNLVPRTIINCSWSGDHRVIDGVTMARMVAQWKSYIEHPEKMLVSLK